ncbi:MAG: hypothetical protein IKN56_08050, partial [Clostridia bacterium]|nr:hypothetical protein [Clostridia bacterium]
AGVKFSAGSLENILLKGRNLFPPFVLAAENRFLFQIYNGRENRKRFFLTLKMSILSFRHSRSKRQFPLNHISQGTNRL